jgi:hypothetical protein
MLEGGGRAKLGKQGAFKKQGKQPAQRMFKATKTAQQIFKVTDKRTAQRTSVKTAIKPLIKDEDRGFFQYDSIPNPWIEDFWLALMNTDIKKDHGEDYDLEIVKRIIANNTFHDELQKTMKIVEGEYSEEKKRVTGNIIKAVANDYIPLWNCLLYDNLESIFKNSTYDKIRSSNMGDSGKLYVNGTTFEYIYKVFNRPAVDNISNFNTKPINDFIGSDFVKITDTGKKIESMIKSWGSNTLHQAHTREVEIDAASKTRSTGIESKYWVETIQNNKNPIYVEYPKYEIGKKNNELSHFFSSRNVILEHKGVKQTGKINVNLYYQNDKNEMTKLDSGLNTAAAYTKKVKNAFGSKEADDIKEAIFLSKHHGDIAQVLSYYRNITLTNFNKQTDIRTKDKDFLHVFETIDILPTLKAFSIGVDCIWFYPPSVASEEDNDKRLIIFKRLKSEKDFKKQEQKLFNEIKRKQKQVATLYKSLKIKVDEYNEKIQNIKTKINNFNTRAVVELDEISARAINLANEKERIEKYKSLIEKGLQIGILSCYLPPVELNAVELGNLNLTVTLSGLQKEYVRLLDIQNNLKISNDFLNLKILKDDGTLPYLNISNIIVFEENKPKYDVCFNRISLPQIKNVSSIGKLTGGLGGTFISGWGLDLLSCAYNNIKNIHIKRTFIQYLSNIFNGNENYSIIFNHAKDLLGITRNLAESSFHGGTRRVTGTVTVFETRKKSKTKTKTKTRNNKFPGEGHVLEDIQDNILLNIVVYELDEYFKFFLDVLKEDDKSKIRELIYKWLDKMYPSEVSHDYSNISFTLEDEPNFDPDNKFRFIFTDYGNYIELYNILKNRLDNLKSLKATSKNVILKTINIQNNIDAIEEYITNNTINKIYEPIETNNSNTNKSEYPSKLPSILPSTYTRKKTKTKTNTKMKTPTKLETIPEEGEGEENNNKQGGARQTRKFRIIHHVNPPTRKAKAKAKKE